jgi:class 3 adenylate cyclase
VAWDYDRSLERIKQKHAEVSDVQVSKLTREMDFDNIALNRPKRIHGAHLYVEIPNFPDIVGRNLADGCEPELLRRLHLHARELTKVCETDFDAAKVHFQGPKLHAVVYRPIDDDEAILRCAFALAAAARRTIEEICNELFDGDAWEVAAGIAIGDTVATKNNLRGDRELLFLGRAANMAARIIDEGILVTKEAADAAPTDLAGYLIETPSGDYELDLPDDELDALIEDQGWAWSLEGSRTRVEEAMEACPWDRVKVSAAKGKIDKAKLGLANSKHVAGVSFFADVDGFTAYVDEAAATDEDLVEAIQAYHVIRSEMRYVAVEDFEEYGALRIQYAGDRMQAIAFLPIDDEATISTTAVEIAAGLHASVKYTLPVVLNDAVRPVAIGQALGTALISRLGEHGQPDVVCIGPATEAAVRYQQALDGWETGISKELRDQLPDELAAEFKWRAAKGCYVSTDLTADKLERQVEGRRLDAGVPALVGREGRGDTSGRPYQT